MPVGRVAKGKRLADTGEVVVNGMPVRKTFGSVMCHGADLQRIGEFPAIASRSPSYMMRQLYDLKRGTRNGLYAEIMKPVVANVTNDEMTAIVAYLASIKPPAGRRPARSRRPRPPTDDRRLRFSRNV